MDNFSGQQIKGYQLKERIAAGGFGAVYRAQQSTVGREVAVKVILPGLANKPDFIRRFEAEAQTIARLEHHFIVPLYDYWRDPDGAYLVMRYLRGGSLHDYIRNQGALNIEEAFTLFSQIAQGLHVAHRNQIIHRDIKPSNVLLDEDRIGFLADFGIAKDHTISQNITEPDSLIGSPEYLAPEQARSEPVTPQTDIYSLGVVLYEMLTGEHPFPEREKIEVIFKHLNDPLPDLITLDDRICNDVNDVIQKATAKDPRQRFSDVVEMIEALRQAAQLDAVATPTSPVELLTPREQEVMQLIIDGNSNREIAELLVLTEGTIRTYITRIYRKLNVRSRVQAIARARDLNFVIQKPVAKVSITTGHLPEADNPYKGLRAFQAADAQDFFGREKLIQKLVSRLQDKSDYNRFLSIVGPSGSGKSSVVKAGLIPALWRGDVPGSENWYMVDLLPAPHPIDELEVSLLQIATDKSLNLHEQLLRDERGLVRVADLVLPDDGSELLIVIDQFEEVFTLVDNEDERLHFLHLIREAVTDKRSRVRVVVTLRADYYDRPLQYYGFGELIRNRVETVLPLGAEELERAVSKPAHRVGVTFEDGLVSHIVSEVYYQPGSLPLLQYALTELFDDRQGRVLTREAYQQFGGTGGALANRADEIYLEQDDDGQELIRQLFLRLVTLGEGAEDTRRRVNRSELLGITANSDMMEEIIDQFAAYRLLSLDHDPATRSPVVQVAHEAILRVWERLRLWLSDSRDEIRLQRALTDASAQWQEADHDASFLLRGARLKQYEDWVAESSIVLTAQELSYLEASLEERQRVAEQEYLRQERETHLEQRSRWFLRGLVAVFAIATVIAVGLTGFALNERNDAVTARTTAEDNFARAERQRLAGLANILLQDDRSNVEVPALLAIRSLNMGYSGEGDTALSRVMAVNLSHLTVPLFPGATGIAISPDMEFVLASSPEDRTVNLLNSSTGEIVDSYKNSFLTQFRFSYDGAYVLLAGARVGWLRDVQTGNELHKFDLDTCRGSAPATAFSPNAHHVLASNGAKDQLVLWDIQSFAEVQHFTGYSECIKDIIFSPDGQLLAGEDEVGAVIVWETATGEIVQVLLPFPILEGIHRLSFVPDSRFLLTASTESHEATLWDIETGLAVRALSGHAGAIRAVAASPDGRFVFTASLDETVRMWDVENGSEVMRYAGCGEGCSSLSISSDGRYLAAFGHDVQSGTARIVMWDIVPQTASPVLIGHADDVTFGVFSPDGQYVLTGSEDNTARLWDAQSGELRHVLSGHSGKLRTATFSLDGRTVYTASEDRSIKVWDTTTGEELNSFGVDTVAADISLSPDGTRLAVVCDMTHRASINDAQTGNIIDFFGGSQIRNVDFSPLGGSILTTSFSNKIEIWDANTGDLTHELDLSDTELTDAVYSPDGEYVLSTASDGLTSIWNAETGELVQDFPGHAIEATRVAFSADSRVLLTGTTEGTVHLWDMENGSELRRIAAPFGALSPDGRSVLTYGNGNTAQLWSVDYTESVEHLCSQLPRDLTALERRQYGITDDTPTCPKFAE